MPKFRRAELWTNLRCTAGATRIRAKIPLYAESGDACKAVLAVDSDESLTIVTSRAWADDAGLTERQVIALMFDDESFDEWRIAKLTWTRDTVTMSCQSPLMDLNEGALLVDSDPDTGEPIYVWGMAAATATEVATGIMTHDAFVAAGLDAVWSVGTVDSTRTLDDVTVTNGSPLAAFRALQAAIRAAGEPCELRARRTGITGYVLDILREVGASAAEIVLQEGRSLDDVVHTSDTRDQATVVSVLGANLAGAPTGVGLARWKVGTITGSGPYVIPLTDPAGGDGPIVADSQFVGDKLFIEKDATALTITASDATNQTVTAASIGSLVAGDSVEFRSSTGAQLTALEHPTYVQDPPTGYGRKVGTLTRSSLTGVAVLNGNAYMRDWTTATDPPDGWALAAFAITDSVVLAHAKITDPLFMRYGGASFYNETYLRHGVVATPVAWTAEYTGQRLSARVAVLIAPSLATDPPGFLRWQGSAAFELMLGVKLGDGSYKLWSAASEKTRVVPPTSAESGGNTTKVAADVWLDVTLNGLDITTPSTGTLLPVTADDITNAVGIVAVWMQAGGSIVLASYVDAIVLTVGALAPGAISEFGGANQLHQIANLLLGERGQPLATYEATVYDLERKDPGTFAADKLTLGMTVRPRGKAVPAGTRVRLPQMQVDYLQPLLTKCVFATPRTKLSDLLLGDSTGTGGIASGGSTSSGGTTGGGTTGSGNTGGSTGGSGGPGSGSGGDTTTPTLAIGITLDASNVPTALATVNSVVTRVKLAGRTDRFPTADEVRAEASVTSAPFTATYAAIDASQTEYVGALAYDAAGNESSLALASASPSATAAVDFEYIASLGVTESGGSVVEWDDQSTNHYDLDVPASDPVKVDAVVNGEPVIRFDSNDSIQTTGTVLPRPDDATLFAVVAPGGTVNNVIAIGIGDGVDTGLQLGAGTTNNRIGGHIDTAGAVTCNESFTGTGSFDVIALRRSGTTVTFFKNGVACTPTFTSNPLGPGSTYAISIGRRVTGSPDNSWVGDVAHGGGASRALSDAEIADLTSALQTKYGLSGGGSSVVSLTYVRSGGDVIVTATARFATSAKIAASLSGTPSDADVRAATELTIKPFQATFPAPATGQTLHVAAFAYFDALGGLESVKATLDIPAEVGTAPDDPAFVLTGADADLPNARVLTDTATIEKDTSVDGQVKLDIVAGSVGATELDATGVTAATYGDATHVAQVTVDANGRITGVSNVAVTTSGVARSIGAQFDGMGSPMTLTGTTKVRVGPVPFSGTIALSSIVLDQSGACTIGVKKCARTSYPGSLADITGGADITISGAAQDEDSTLSGWTTTVTADDVFEFELKSVDGTITQAEVLLKVT